MYADADSVSAARGLAAALGETDERDEGFGGAWEAPLGPAIDRGRIA